MKIDQKKSELRTALLAHGWECDSWGNYKKKVTRGGKESICRIVFKDRVVRVEKQFTIDGGQYSKDRKEWLRIGGGSYKECVVIQENETLTIVIGSLKMTKKV